jgi:hypothetical protein
VSASCKSARVAPAYRAASIFGVAAPRRVSALTTMDQITS